MGDETVGLFKSAVIKEKLDALACRHFAFFVLAFAALLSSAFFSQPVAALQFMQLLFQVHGRGL